MKDERGTRNEERGMREERGEKRIIPIEVTLLYNEASPFAREIT